MKTIDGFEILPYLPPPFPDDSWLSIDVEIFGLKKGRFHKPEGVFASLALTNDGQKAYVLTDVKDLKDYFQHLLHDSDCGAVLQNASFDIFHLRRWMDFPVRKRFWDTMLCDRILWGGYYEDYSLKGLTRRYLKAHMEKDVRSDFEKATELTDEMIYYNAVDAVATWRIAQEQMKLYKKSHKKVWEEIDAPAMWAFLEFRGPMIDVEKWEGIAEKNEAIADGIAQEFGFNPRSPKQVKEYLSSIGIKVESTGAEVLERHKSNEVVAKILEYRGVQKLASTYGKSWITKHIEEDGRVKTSYDVNRAESGRTSSSEPNLQNIPIRKSPAFRECFIAAPGNVLICGDYSQQEVRGMAYLSQDENLIEIFKSGRDVYSEVASYIYKEPITKEDERRQKTKSLVLGIIYGLTPFGLVREFGCSEEEAEELFSMFFARFSKVRAWMDKQQAKVDTYVRTAAGRKCWLNPYSSQAQRNACNSPSQGSAADMLKRAIANLYESWDREVELFPAVLQVHDEILIEVKAENEQYAIQTLEESMLIAGEYVIPNVPVAVEVKSGASWAQVH